MDMKPFKHDISYALGIGTIVVSLVLNRNLPLIAGFSFLLLLLFLDFLQSKEKSSNVDEIKALRVEIEKIKTQIIFRKM